MVDCAGRHVSPGWVDFHGHADWTCLDHPGRAQPAAAGLHPHRRRQLRLAPGPVTGPATALLARGEGKGYHAATIDALAERYPRLAWSLGDFLGAVERARPGVNYVQLAGHNRLRQAVMGHAERPASGLEVRQMGALLEACLDEGAFGLTSGLVFIPGCWAEPAELVQRPGWWPRDGLYATTSGASGRRTSKPPRSCWRRRSGPGCGQTSRTCRASGPSTGTAP